MNRPQQRSELFPFGIGSVPIVEVIISSRRYRKTGSEKNSKTGLTSQRRT